MKRTYWIGLVLLGALLWWTWSLTQTPVERQGPEVAAPAPNTQAPPTQAEPEPEPTTPSAAEPEADSRRAPVEDGAPADGTPADGEDEPPQDPPWTLVFAGPEGTPVDGLEASVRLTRGRAGQEDHATEQRESTPEIGPDGRARWALDAGGWEKGTVEAWAPGFVPKYKRLDVRPGETDVLELEPGASVTGHVVDRHGQPSPETYVGLKKRDAAGKLNLLSGTRTDEGGWFRVGTITHGPCLLEAHERQVGRVELDLDLVPGEQWDAGTLVLQGEGELVGQVVLADSQPAQDFVLQIELRGSPDSQGSRRSQLRTDEEGRFHFRGLAQGEFQIDHFHDPLPQFGKAGRVRTDTGELLLELQAVMLTVRAEDGEGEALEMASLAVIELETEETLFEDHYGVAHAEVEVLIPIGQPYRLEADAGEVTPRAVVELVAEGTQREVVLRPTATGDQASLQVVVHGPGGELETEYWVYLLPEGGFRESMRSPDELEEGAFRGLEPGTYGFGLGLSRRPPWESTLYTLQCPAEVRLFAGQVTRVEATVARGGHVELDLSSVEKMQDHQQATLSAREAADPGAGFAELQVYRRTTDGFTWSSSLDLGSSWTVEDPLPPGSWLLRLETAGYRTWEQAVVVQPGETVRLKVTMERE
jgi:hypothetical protein